MQTKVSVSKEDSGKSIRMRVGDMLEVSLPETDAEARWRVEVDTEVLAPVSSLTDAQTVWVLDEVEQAYVRTFRAAHVGHAILKMSYDSVKDGAVVDNFTLEVTVGDAPKPKVIRQSLPAPQLVILLVQFFFVAGAGALLSLRLTLLVATRTPHATADLLIALLGTVALTAVAGLSLLRIIGFFASRMR